MEISIQELKQELEKTYIEAYKHGLEDGFRACASGKMLEEVLAEVAKNEKIDSI